MKDNEKLFTMFGSKVQKNWRISAHKDYALKNFLHNWRRVMHAVLKLSVFDLFVVKPVIIEREHKLGKILFVLKGSHFSQM